MFFFKFRQTWLRFLRLLEITSKVLAHFISDWFTGTRLYRFFRKPKNREEVMTRSTPSRIRELVEDLGPTFIKFGQILADRPDLVSEKFRNELKKLQTAARPLPDEEAIALIEEELGGPLELFFSRFETKCLASASIGQVYAGRLKNGDDVVVKIQRPGIYTKIRTDLSLMKILAAKLVRRNPELASLNIVSFVDEFSESLVRELNYHNEANNILRFTELLKNEPAFYAPRVYNEFTTKRLLVMERIHGIAPDEFDKINTDAYDPNLIAENGTKILLSMILDHGVFHADPHAGNIFILPDNRICFIDYGMVAVLRPAHIRFLADFTIGFASSSPTKIASALIDLSGKKFFAYEEDLRFEIEEVMKRYSYLPATKVDISSVMLDCITLVVKYELQIPSSIYMLLKALAAIQKFAMKLAPDFAIAELIEPFARKVVRRQYAPKKIAGLVVDAVTKYIGLARDLPGDIDEIIYNLKAGKLVHEVSLKEDKQLRKTIRITSLNIGLAFASALMLLCSTVIYASGNDPGMARAGFLGALLLGGWLLVRSIRRSMPA